MLLHYSVDKKKKHLTREGRAREKIFFDNA